MRTRTIHDLVHRDRRHHGHERRGGEIGAAPTGSRHRRHGPDGHGHRLGGFRRQARRGALREAILALLAEGPMHGYQMIQELERRSGGRWRPSAGSIYPTLEQLNDEGLVAAEEHDGRRVFSLTDAGRDAAAGLPGEPTWTGGRGGRGELGAAIRDLAAATRQVERVGSPDATAEASRILADARRNLYRLLADDTTAPTASEDAERPR